MRTTSSTAVMKIFPSPMRPVRAPPTIASTISATRSSGTSTESCTLGRKSTTYSAPR